MVTVSTPADAYQDLAELRDRLDYRGSDFFDDNEQLRFDELLVRLEEESRGIFETLWGDQTPLEETGRTDETRPTDDAALKLVYPINDVTTVEIRRASGSDWETLDSDRYTHSDHHLILAEASRTVPRRAHAGHRGNPLTRYAERDTWRDLAWKVRVTYDRGFGADAPSDIKSVQVQIINNMLRQLKREQTVAAASPEQFAGQTEMEEVVTQEIRDRVSDVTKPGYATTSI